MTDSVNGDRIADLHEEDAVVARAQPTKAIELAGERFDSARAGFGEAVKLSVW